MSAWKKGVAASLIVLQATACTAEPEPTKRLVSHHVSPVQPALPVMADGAFDETVAQQNLDKAKLERAAGDGQAARTAALAAVDHWPSMSAAWLELRADCQMLGDDACFHYAGFFLTKVDFAATIPPRAASLGFETIAANPPGSKAGDFVYDAESLAMARRLWAFYGLQDPLEGGNAVPFDQQTWSEKYPYGVAILAIGVGAALVTAVKTLASK